MIPSSGFLKIDIEYQCEQASLSDIAHDEGISNVISAIRDSKTEAERIVLFEQAITSPYYYMSAQQALMLYEEVSKHVAGDLDVIGTQYCFHERFVIFVLIFFRNRSNAPTDS